MKFQLGETGAFNTTVEYGTLDISGNSELGFRPYQLLVSSIAGCSGGVLRRVLEKKRIAFDTIEIEAEVERNEKEANRITRIALHFIVYGKDLDLKQVQKSLEVSSKNCSMVQSVKDAIEIIETIEVRETEIE